MKSMDETLINYIIESFEEAGINDSTEYYGGLDGETDTDGNEDFSISADILAGKVKYSCDYADGASKFVILSNAFPEYVIKVPYNRADYDYEPYCGAGFRGSETDWDYCALESYIYEKACERGLSQFFAGTRFLAKVNGYPIYYAERAEDFYSDNNFNNNENEYINSAKQYKNTQMNPCFNHYLVGDLFLGKCLEYYGDEAVTNFFAFCNEFKIGDIRAGRNIGIINGRPVLLDYSNFFEE